MHAQKRRGTQLLPSSLLKEAPVTKKLTADERQTLDGLEAAYAAKLKPFEKRVRDFIEADVEARRAFRLLSDKACRRYSSAADGVLLVYIVMAQFSPDCFLEWYELMREGHPGADRLPNLIERLRDDADRVEAVNGDPNWLGWVPSKLGPFREGATRRKAMAGFANLPRWLRLYADNLEIKLGRARLFISQGSRRAFQSDATLALLRAVHALTGRYYFERVASILRAVRQCTGREPRVSANSLRQLWHRPHAPARKAEEELLAQRRRQLRNIVRRANTVRPTEHLSLS